MEGWIKIHRDIKNHWIYEDPKLLKWWLSILLNVNHKSKNIPVGSELIECGPGQSFMSIDTWTSIFGCSKKTTIKFFEKLQNQEMIKCKTIGKGNRRKHLLTVVNWNKYQVEETKIYTERVPEFTPKGNSNVTPNKNDKNEKNNNIVAKATVSDRKEKFYNTLIPFLSAYSKDMIREFFDYWTELNKSQTKMRFEMEKTWETKKRLITWSGRCKVEKRTSVKTPEGEPKGGW